MLYFKCKESKEKNMTDDKLFVTAKMTSKGQVTIPKIIRDNLNIDEGDSIIFYLDKNNNILLLNSKNCKIKIKQELGK